MISDSWYKLAPKDLPALLVDAESQTAVLGLLSIHQSGYVRQEAVRQLTREKSGDELPYLLLRQNDWVSIVGDEAQEAIRTRLLPDYLPHFVRCLPLVMHLLQYERRDLSHIVRKVVEMLVQPDHNTMLTDVLWTSNRSVRRQVVQVALDLQGEHRARVIQHGLSSTDAVIRLACAKRASQVLSAPDLDDAFHTFQQDRFMPIRRVGFCLQAEGSPVLAPTIWRRALFDPHASIRELARFHLEKLGLFDIAAFYRQALADQGISLPTVSGLAECGDDTDLPVLRGFLAHLQPCFRRAAIRGIARIAKEGAVDELVRSLRDSSLSVVRESKMQLEPHLALVPGSELFAVACEAETQQARILAIQLISGKSKWQSLPWLIRIASQVDEQEASLARRLVEDWFSNNSVYTKPSAAEREAIEEAIGGLKRTKDEAFLEKLRRWIREI